ncbi:hypothetical protein C7P63_05395 [Vagococcus humatus]|uniref:Uncharacterized protein n=2 Tax=Vagococcus humatus TaxID=1889241 RepID=A0A3S0A551_9ENTE|nr:hypothetical protein C7P63_05395 [Vagococcus humatus]
MVQVLYDRNKIRIETGRPLIDSPNYHRKPIMPTEKDYFKIESVVRASLPAGYRLQPQDSLVIEDNKFFIYYFESTSSQRIEDF